MKWIISIFALSINLWAAGPLSKEVTFVETYSASEVTLKASGLGEDSEEALEDMRKAALWFVLEGGTDPLLSSNMSKEKFAEEAKAFYKPSNLSKYITWEAAKITGRVRLTLPNGDDGVKVTKSLRINKKMLTDELVNQGIIKSLDELSQGAGQPTLMVIPEAPKGQSPLEVLDKNELAKHAAGVIESYLTSRKYEVTVPRGADQIQNLVNLTNDSKGNSEDLTYQIALTIGSDIYMTYSGEVKGGKASVVVKAYETTTARLLGTETGYSQTRPGAPMQPLVEEAINDAVTNVLQRINNYWADDLKNGVQYKLIIQTGESIPAESREDVQFEIQDVIESLFARSKENVVTDKTLDYSIWAPADEFASSSSIYRQLKRKVKGGELNRISINRKLIQLQVDAN